MSSHSRSPSSSPEPRRTVRSQVVVVQRKEPSSRSPSPKRRRRSPSDEGRDEERRRRRSPSDEGRDAERRRRRSPSDEGRDAERRRRRSPSDDSRGPREKRTRAADFFEDRPDKEERRREKGKEWEERTRDDDKAAPAEKTDRQKRAEANPLLTRAGGAYIPPAKLRMMQEQIADKNSEQFQRMNWERIKKKIHGQVNKVNTGNIVTVVRELLQENVIRGKGLLARSIIQAQSFSPSFSHVYAALVAIINSKFPNIGELILRRLVIQFKRSFRRNDKTTCITVSRFIGHLANQRVAHEILVLEMLILLMEQPTDDSIEVAITLLKECGEMLTKVTPKGTHAIFERLRSILSDCDTIEQRTQYMIEVMMHIRKDKFKAYPAVIEELDLIDEEEQISHIIQLNPDDGKPHNPELELNVFKFDPDFETTEQQYEEIRREIIGDADDSDEEEEEGGEEGEEGDDAAAAAATTETQKIVDMTEQDMVAFRRNVYLTIQSSLDYQEAAHKLIKNELKPKLEAELCHMIVDCCAQMRTYERFYGLLAERFCKLKMEFQNSFEQIARDTYHAIHRFDITKLRNMAKLVAHLLTTDAINWQVLAEMKLNEQDTTSSGRIYIKIIFQELAETLGVVKLYERINDPTLQTAFEGLFPRDHPKNTRFAINFFSLIGLAGLTIDLREHLQKKIKKEEKEESEAEESSSSDSSSDSSDSSSDSSDSSSDSSDSSSDSSDSSGSVRRRKSKKSKAARKGKDSGKQIKEETPEHPKGRKSGSEHKRRENAEEARETKKDRPRKNKH